MTEIVVIGAGVAGLVAARHLAKTGATVTLIDSSTTLGGQVASETIDGQVLDVGAESFAVRGGTVAALAKELGLEVVAPAPVSAWLALPGRTVPLPAAGVLGIPGSPLSTDVRAVIGGRASWRAYLDRLIPVLKVGRAGSLGDLVRSRMGQRVLDDLVTPVVSNVYNVLPDDVLVDDIAPQLNAAMTTSGSLSSLCSRCGRRPRPDQRSAGSRAAWFGLSKLWAPTWNVVRFESSAGQRRSACISRRKGGR